jgi:uncharacterized RDD family membrane protein YckC
MTSQGDTAVTAQPAADAGRNSSQALVGRVLEPGSLATLGERVAARVLDAAAVLFLTLLLMPSLGDLPRDLVGLRLILTAAFLVSATYEVACVGTWGQTLGKRMLGTKVVVFPNGGAVGYRKAAVRFLMLVVIPVTVLGLGRAARDAGRRGLHDAVAGTVVVRSAGGSR